jgi:hypothetical protein
MGHVALSTGDGNLIEAGYDVIIRSTIRDENHNAPYLGWAWPPLNWPGRSDVFRATALVWVIQAGKAVMMTFASWLGFLIIKNREKLFVMREKTGMKSLGRQGDG